MLTATEPWPKVSKLANPSFFCAKAWRWVGAFPLLGFVRKRAPLCEAVLACIAFRLLQPQETSTSTFPVVTAASRSVRLLGHCNGTVSYPRYDANTTINNQAHDGTAESSGGLSARIAGLKIAIAKKRTGSWARELRVPACYTCHKPGYLHGYWSWEIESCGAVEPPQYFVFAPCLKPIR